MADEIMIRRLTTPEDMVEVSNLYLLVWPGSEISTIPPSTYMDINNNGGVVLGAFCGDMLVGYVFGFLGIDNESLGTTAMTRIKHHSHILGVHPDYRNLGIGLRLKLEQRRAVINQGIRLVTWTFDPLLSNNAYLNIRRLGTVCHTYFRDFYGRMQDDISIGIPSDRFRVDWWVTSPRVVSRIEGKQGPPDQSKYLDSATQKVNPASLGSDGLLLPPDQFYDLQGDIALVEIPSDFQTLKRQDIELARGWRRHTRQIFETAFADGYMVVDFLYYKNGDFPRSYYVLSKEADSRNIPAHRGSQAHGCELHDEFQPT